MATETKISIPTVFSAPPQSRALKLYRKCVPASEKDPRCLLTPKLRCLLVYVEKWIEVTGETLIGISEGAFETFHQDYRQFEINFKVPRPPPGRDETASDTTTEQNPDTPACGTRSGIQKKRKAAEDKAAAQANKRRTIINVQIRPRQSRK